MLINLSINTTIILLYLTALLVGYIIGKTNRIQVYYNQESPNTQKSNSKEKQQETEKIIEEIKSINIDDTIYIHKQDTSGMEKKFDNISTIQEQETEIDKSISKLSKIIQRRS
jgi:hypothetical protein